jgi:hypothetical protein
MNYRHETALHHWNLIHDPNYWLLEHQADIESQNLKSITPISYDNTSETENLENLTDIDSNEYTNTQILLKHVKTLESEIKDTRITLNQIYKSLLDGSDLSSRVRMMRENKTVEEVKKKETEDLLSKARKLKI